MHQIYITAILTTLLAFFAIGGFIKWRSNESDSRFFLLLFLIELPMALIAYYLVRLPLLDYAVKSLVGDKQFLYGFLRNFYAPLTEEPAKLLPLLIPFVRRRITKENFVWVAMSLGLGFGIGEIWLVAVFIASNVQFANIPWYLFTGFLNERLMVCVIHGAFTSVALWRLNNKFIFGILGAMGLHFLGNFPIYLSRINFGNFGEQTWQVIVAVWLQLYVISMVLMLMAFKLGKLNVRKFMYDLRYGKIGYRVNGKSVCPECGNTYKPPFIVLNWFTKKYEKCPYCKKWHWISFFKKPH